MSQNDLSPARLRALIAAATPGPWFGQYEYDGSRTVCQMRSCTESFCINMASHVDGKPYRDTKANAELITYLVNNAPALADALEIAQSIQAEFPLFLEESRKYWKTPDGIDAIHAAKEAADADKINQQKG